LAPYTHIVILCSRLDLPGGIERAVVNTSNLLAENGYRVTLLVLDRKASSFYPISSNVVVRHQQLHFGITGTGNPISRKKDFISHTQTLRKTLLELSPQGVLCSEYPFSIAAYLAVSGKGIAVFAWEHHHFFHLKKSWFWERLFRFVYPKLDGVVCLNESEKNLFDKIGCRSVVIPNFIRKNEQLSLQSKTLLTVGWLTKLKGVDFIPAIAKKVFSQCPDWRWVLIGKGEEEAWLTVKIKEYNLEGKIVVVPPSAGDLDAIYRQASLYVMTSRMECFPMVLLEAMSFGIPSVAFDCPTGPAAIIRSNEHGFLIEPGDVDAVAAAIVDLIIDYKKRAVFGANAYRNADRFSQENAIALWKHLWEKG
jgi:glycosyltransferase involved in cell wall biosynthesis